MCSDGSFPPGRPNVPVNRLPLRVQAQPGDALLVSRSSEVLKVGAQICTGRRASCLCCVKSRTSLR